MIFLYLFLLCVFWISLYAFLCFKLDSLDADLGAIITKGCIAISAIILLVIYY